MADEVEVTRYAHLPKPLKISFIVLSTAGVGIAIFYLFGFSIRGQVLVNYAYYYLLVALYSACGFLILPARKKDKRRVPWYDLIAAALAFGIALYFFLHAWEIILISWVPSSTLNFVLGLIFSVLILEGSRRMTGRIYPAICLFFFVYPWFAEYMPGSLYGISFPFNRVVASNIFGAEGILGLPLQVMGNILIGFLVFSAVMIASGAGTFFLKIAIAILGRFRGGPAKVSVLASGLFGMLSGSIFSNIAAVGTFTIPAMKRIGYEPEFAGAVEACSSTGGVLMPPVMGAVAFVMAIFLGIDYGTVALAAVIPAILYYLGLLMQVDSHAAKIGLKGLPREEIPSLRSTLKEGWPFLTVLIFLSWWLLYIKWAALTPFYASALMVLLSFTNRKTMMTPRRFIDALG